MLHLASKLLGLVPVPFGEGTAITDIGSLITNGVNPMFEFFKTCITGLASTIMGSPFLLVTTCIMIAMVGFKALGKILRQY